MALVDLVERVRNALSVNADYDAQIESAIKAAGRRLLRDYNFPKQIAKLTYPLVAAGSQYLALPADFKKALGVRLSQFEEATTFWSEPFTRVESFVLPSNDGVPRKYWIEGTNLWMNSAMPQEGLDVVLWYQSHGWDENATWLLSDFEDTLFYFTMTRIAPEVRKKEVFEVFAPLWSDERQSIAIYLNELEWDDVTILMREPQAYVVDRQTLQGLGSPSIFSLYGRAFVQVEDAAGARALLDLGAAATFDILPIANGGTGASSQAQAQLNFGLRPGIEVQAYDTDLAAIAAISTTAYGRGFLGLADNAAARSYLSLGTLSTQNTAPVAMGGTGATDAPGARTNLGLVIGTHVQAFDADLDAIAALSTTAFGRGFLDLADNAAARAKLSLGTAAIQNIGTSGATIPLLSTSNSWTSQQLFASGTAAAPGLSFSGDDDTGFYRPGSNTIAASAGGVEIFRVSSAGFTFANSGQVRTALGLGDMATQDAGAVNITGGNAVFDRFGIVVASDPYIDRYSEASGNGSGILMRRARGTPAAPLATLSGDILGGFYLSGYQSVTNNWAPNVAAFYAYAMEDYTSTGYGSEAAVGTTSIGGTSRITRLRIGELGTYPGGNNLYSLGTASARWSEVYAATGTINTSDERSKQDIGAIPEAWLDAWGDVDWRRYKFIDAVQAKGEDARWHIGLIAQAVRDAFAARGLDGQAIGLLCHDEWEAETESLGEDGSILREARDAGDRWGLRYDECLAMEAAYQRRRLSRIEAKLAALEA